MTESATQAALDLFDRGGPRQSIQVRGPRGGRLACLVARLAQAAREDRSPLVVLASSADQAAEIGTDLRCFLDEGQPLSGHHLGQSKVVVFAEELSPPYSTVSVDRKLRFGLMSGLFRLSAAAPTALKPSVIVVTPTTLRPKVIVPDRLVAYCRTLRAQCEFDRDELVECLDCAGYERFPVAEDPGTYAVRGAILDIYTPLERLPIRVEYIGDQIETLNYFDPETQRTLRPATAYPVYPLDPYLRTTTGDVRSRLFALADESGYPSRAIRDLAEHLAQNSRADGNAGLLPAYHDRLGDLWDYLPAGAAWLLLDSEDATIARLRAEDLRFEEQYLEARSDARIVYPPDALAIPASKVLERLRQGQRIVFGEAATTLAAPIEISTRDHKVFSARLSRLREEGKGIGAVVAAQIREWVSAGARIMIATIDARNSQRLQGLLEDNEIGATSLKTGALEQESSLDPGVYLVSARLSSGFRANIEDGEASHWITYQELFGAKVKRRSVRKVRRRRLGDLKNISLGDPLVHAEHGIGLYRGLCCLVMDAVASDFLLLEYAAGDRLYLPVHRLSQVHRYTGSGDDTPKLDKLGGATWRKKRARVESSVRHFGEQLLQLYAQREALSGYAHPQPDDYYHAFEQSFPFEETGDQLKAIEETLADLVARRPMDRLICGDVGFGKTEVALRAAFLVAMGGRQVALLAPTTVLAEQHVRTFQKRFSPFPLRVEVVSRFKRNEDVRRLLEDCAAGKIDVVIGTHRLLSPDVRFADLGLVIFDEEQRFGVQHKEKMKRFRTKVDVLAMTATPIPRTLQLSLVGMRQISIIETAPADRLSVRTLSATYDGALVAGVIRKEMARQGQVFFVHNEVRSIEQWVARLRGLVPEARIGLAHGQLHSRTLERTMLDFVDGRFDLLVCTTIVESGLDIPRANTMLVNRADRFGLAQLYQLRGRIGRSERRAYCYLLLDDRESLSADALARIRLLEEFSELGSGFSIASHDLELRGAGDLLGVKQSGHVAAVGFETYAKILRESTASLKGEAIQKEQDPELTIRFPCYIGDEYVEDMSQRLELYKRLSDAATTEDEISQIMDEIRDRYGPLPTEVEALAALMEIKGIAMRLRVGALEVTETELLLDLGANPSVLAPALLANLLEGENTKISLKRGTHLAFQLSAFSSADPEQGEARSDWPLFAAKRALRQLFRRVNQGAGSPLMESD